LPLVFLHGPAAAGKYTVARELAALTGLELYHNHLVVDEVLKDHAFGTPGFVAERDRRWRGHLGAALRRHPPGRIIFTFNPENTVPQAFIDWLFSAAPAAGVPLHSVEITAPESSLEARMGSAQRRTFRKLVDLELYRKLRDTGVFRTPVIPRTDLIVDTTAFEPADAAGRIRDHFRLG
jgi:hypothetical protein